MFGEYRWLVNGYSWDYIEFCEYVSRQRSSMRRGAHFAQKHVIVLGYPAKISYGSYDISKFVVALVDNQLRVFEPKAKIVSHR